MREAQERKKSHGQKKCFSRESFSVSNVSACKISPISTMSLCCIQAHNPILVITHPVAAKNAMDSFSVLSNCGMTKD